MTRELTQEILTAIRESLKAVNQTGIRCVGTLGAFPVTISDASIDEMARNAAQNVVGAIEMIESEEKCPVCERCIVCGEGKEHEH